MNIKSSVYFRDVNWTKAGSLVICLAPWGRIALKICTQRLCFDLFVMFCNLLFEITASNDSFIPYFTWVG